MANNISKEYISFCKKNINNYAKIILESHYQKDVFLPLLDIYIDVRYYNAYENIYKSYGQNINYYLKNKVTELIKTSTDNDKKRIENNYLVFKYILYLDNVIELTSISNLTEEVLLFRKINLLLSDNSNFTKEFPCLVKENEKKKKNYLNSFTNNKFILKMIKTNNKNVYFIELLYNIHFPKIYSEYSINKVYKSGIVNEDKLFIMYHLVNKQILDNTIKGIYNLSYIVDFPISIFEKNDKLTRLFNTINDESVKENIIIKFKYKDYLLYKDEIVAYIKEGYKFAIELDETFDYKETSKIWLDIFTYIIVDSSFTYSIDEKKIIIKK